MLPGRRLEQVLAGTGDGGPGWADDRVAAQSVAQVVYGRCCS